MKTLSSVLIFILLGCSSTPTTQSGWDYSEKHLDFKLWRRKADCCSAKGKKFGIAAGGTHSAQAGNEVYRQGGNAVDAAVTVAFAEAVERPHSMGLGGGGFMLIHLPHKRDVFVDFRETAPGKASKNMYLDAQGKVIEAKSTEGLLSVATPGFVIGLFEVHKKWGKLPWARLLVPAIRMADDGFLVYPSLANTIAENQQQLRKDPYVASLLFKKEGEPLQTGDRLVQKDLAETLRKVSRNGGAEFRSGYTAKKIADYMAKHGGLVSLDDMKKYRVQYREPIQGKWKGYSFVSAPPPSAGGIVLAQMFQVLEGLGFPAVNQVDSVQYLAESLKQGYADRAAYIGDPDFVKVPIATLTSKAYTDKIRERIKKDGIVASHNVKAAESVESQHTSHFSVMDDTGAAIGCTLTINTSFGSGLAAPGTGVFLNNEMDDFSVKPGEKNAYGLTGAEANSIAPYKRPVSSMSPTIVYKDGKPVLTVGAAGGSRIITAVAQITLGTLEYYSGDAKKALFAPRAHHQWLPDKLEFEEGYAPQVVSELAKRGYETGKREYHSVAQAVHRADDGTFTAVFDPRDEGGAEAH